MAITESPDGLDTQQIAALTDQSDDSEDFIASLE
jgi:hypothetical protein